MWYKDVNPSYDNYDDYLQGEWQAIHEYIYQLRLFPYRCRVCFVKKALLLHKRSYGELTLAGIKKLSKRMLKKIFVWLCHRCNSLIHFYTDKQKVPLDYLFLWEREKRVWIRPDMVIRRAYRGTWYIIRWFRYSYSIKKKRHL